MIFSQYSENVDLSQLHQMCESITMRRETILANCGSMEERLNNEFDLYSLKKLNHGEKIRIIQKLFAEAAKLIQSPKTFYDYFLMKATVEEIHREITLIGELEKDLLKMSNEVNSKFLALVSLFNASIDDLKDITRRSKHTIIKLINSSSNAMKQSCVQYEKIFSMKKRGFTVDYLLNPDYIPKFWPDFLLENDADPTSWRTLRIKEISDQLSLFSASLPLPPFSLSSLTSSCVAHLPQLSLLLASLTTSLLSITPCFPVPSAGMAGSAVEFPPLYSSFNTRLTFIVNNHLIKWGIVEKGALKVRGRGEHRRDDFQRMRAWKIKEIQLLEGHPLRDAPDAWELEKYVRHARRVALEVVQAGWCVVEEGARDLADMFREVGEHCVIQESFFAFVDDSEVDMMDTLKIDKDIAKLLDRKLDIEPSNQLIFAPELDMNTLFAAFSDLNKRWRDLFIPFQRLETVQAKPSKLEGYIISEEFESDLDLSEEDLSIASIHTYSARINKKRIPVNGKLCLALDYLIFTSEGNMIGSLNILLPYSEIIDITGTKNFFGKSNGISIMTNKGVIEAYVDNKGKRDQLIAKLLNLIEIGKVGKHSSITKLFSYADEINFGLEMRVKIPSEYIELAKKRVLQAQKKMMIGYYDSSAPLHSIFLEGETIESLITLIFCETPYYWDGELFASFNQHFHSRTGISKFEIISSIPRPSFSSSLSSFFTTSLPTSTSSYHYTLASLPYTTTHSLYLALPSSLGVQTVLSTSSVSPEGGYLSLFLQTPSGVNLLHFARAPMSRCDPKTHEPLYRDLWPNSIKEVLFEKKRGNLFKSML